MSDLLLGIYASKGMITPSKEHFTRKLSLYEYEQAS